ncbi:MAG: phosphatidylglycerol lysyltransferase domain-containing protein [Selenomonadaceae bacterium]|nr:phosphatidylglycerol lysyltransferase domain-containing protein [Selenomonadaceae bacterium]
MCYNTQSGEYLPIVIKLDRNFKEWIIINLNELTCADKPIFDKFFGSQYCENAEYTFTNLFMWRNMLNLRWGVEDDVLYMFSSDEKTFGAWQPIGASEKMQDAITKILEVYKQEGGDKKFMFVVVEKVFADELARYPHVKFNIVGERNNFDYVYLAQDLINLSGRKFHGKKNHLNSFRKDYPDAKYVPITEEIIPKCREELNQWARDHKRANPDDPFIGYEQAAIHEIFDHFGRFKLKGGAILLNDKVVAFTFGERLNSDTAVIHVEKANPNIRGVYVAINHDFVEHEWIDMTFINREEDMGIEGLRQAKESYRPIKMVEKYDATIAE